MTSLTLQQFVNRFSELEQQKLQQPNLVHSSTGRGGLRWLVGVVGEGKKGHTSSIKHNNAPALVMIWYFGTGICTHLEIFVEINVCDGTPKITHGHDIPLLLQELVCLI